MKELKAVYGEDKLSCIMFVSDKTADDTYFYSRAGDLDAVVYETRREPVEGDWIDSESMEDFDSWLWYGAFLSLEEFQMSVL